MLTVTWTKKDETVVRRFGRFVRKVSVLAAVLAIVVAAGITALRATTRATSQQEAVHRRDRMTLTVALATLAQGYLGQMADEQAAVAVSIAPSTGAGTGDEDHALAAALRKLPGASAGVLTDADGRVLAATGDTTLRAWLPSHVGSMRPVLGRQAPGISPLAEVGGVPTVAVAVPVGPAGALLGVSYDVEQLSIAAYVSTLQIGPQAHSWVVDGNGVVFASPQGSAVGRRAAAPVRAAMARMPSGRGITLTPGSDPMVVAAAPVGVAGYHLVVIQPASDFYGALWHSSTTTRWALLCLLVIAATALLVLHSRRQAALAAVADMAVRDALTGLPNRLAFSDALDDAMERHRRDGVDVALLFCDLDGFKTVNDELGHGVGDRLLVAVADRLRRAVEATVGDHAVLARLGGDEFTVLLETPHATPHAQHLADALTEALAKPFVLGAEEVRVGVSVGIAYAHPGRDLLKDADVAMYRTKATRRAARRASAPDAAPGTVVTARPGPGAAGGR